MEKSADARYYSSIHDAPVWGMIGTTGGLMAPGWHTNGRFVQPLKSDTEERPTSPANPDGNVTSNEQGFGSPHTGITNAVLGDGSTQSLRNTIEWDVLQDICFRNDGFVVSHDDF